jgi:hypothetical protein
MSSGGSDEVKEEPATTGLRRLVSAGVSVGGALAGWKLGGPGGAALAAGVGPALDEAIARVNAFRQHHVEQVVTDAADIAGLEIGELIDRLLEDELRGELAARALLAAQDAGTAERLRALSRSLAAGALASDAEGVAIELLYVRALADLDAPHVYVLTLFSSTWRELGLGDQDTLPPDGLNYGQLQQAAQLGDALDPIVGILLRHGLVDERTAPGGMTFQAVLGRGNVRLTSFGRSLLDRMMDIGSADEPGDRDGGLNTFDVEEVVEVVEDQDLRIIDLSQDDADGVSAADTCLVCGAPATHHAVPSRPFLHYEDGESPSGAAMMTLPPMPLCDNHVRALAAKKPGLGWCMTCRRWGEAERECPTCGVRFQRYG